MKKRAEDMSESEMLLVLYRAHLRRLVIVFARFTSVFGSVFHASPEQREASIADAVMVLRSRSHFPEQRSLAVLLLDMLWPQWREREPELVPLSVERSAPEVRAWRDSVIGRDGSCRACGSREELHAHHVVPWAIAPHLRLLVRNGVVLCQRCHVQQHKNLVEPLWA